VLTQLLDRGINISVGSTLALVNMVEKETVGVRLAPDKVNKIEQLAEEKNITKSDATRRIIDKGIRFDESGIENLLTNTNNNRTEENQETVADGGQVFRRLLHSVSGFYAVATISIFTAILYYSVVGISMPYPDLWYIAVTACGLATSLSSVLLYTEIPERADRVLYSGVSRVPVISKVVA
jgi:hypothetical protein